MSARHQPTPKPAESTRRRLLCGMRPTGRLHVGHFAGALESWTGLQDEFDCFCMAGDWRALAARYEDPSGIQENTIQIAIDWMSAGIDPEKSTLFIQSRVKEHAELALLLGMLTPVTWLMKSPAYRELALDTNDKTLETLGFLGCPALQSADILLYKAQAAPVGEDQLPHLEMCREIARRFNFLYRPLFPEPRPILSRTPRLPGLDGRRMSRKWDNAIYLSDRSRRVEMKVREMVTDPQRARRTDPGRPEVCSVFAYHQVFNAGESEPIAADCRNAAIGCVDCKIRLAGQLNALLEPMRERRATLEAKPGRVENALEEGSARAAAVARQTMAEVREALRLPDSGPLAAMGKDSVLHAGA